MSKNDTSGLLDFFDILGPHVMDALQPELEGDTLDGLLIEARDRFSEFLPDIPYQDNPTHTMAQSMFFCAAGLAFLKPMLARGHDAHTVGRAVYAFTKEYNEARAGEADVSQSEGAREKSRRDAEASQSTTDPREFIWEVIGTRDDGAWAFNVTSCAICKLFSKYEGMELVPYMCASDDAVSDAYGQGLRRTGTIGLGAHQCDFRFHDGETGKSLAEQYPDRIRLTNSP